MMSQFMQAHDEVLREIKLIEKSIVLGTEEAYAKELQINALHAKAHAIRTKAKEFYPTQPPKRIVNKLVDNIKRRWQKELEPTPEMPEVPEVPEMPEVPTKCSKLDKFDYSDKDINSILDEMGYNV